MVGVITTLENRESGLIPISFMHAFICMASPALDA